MENTELQKNSKAKRPWSHSGILQRRSSSESRVITCCDQEKFFLSSLSCKELLIAPPLLRFAGVIDLQPSST